MAAGGRRIAEVVAGESKGHDGYAGLVRRTAAGQGAKAGAASVTAHLQLVLIHARIQRVDQEHIGETGLWGIGEGITQESRRHVGAAQVLQLDGYGERVGH